MNILYRKTDLQRLHWSVNIKHWRKCKVFNEIHFFKSKFILQTTRLIKVWDWWCTYPRNESIYVFSFFIAILRPSIGTSSHITILHWQWLQTRRINVYSSHYGNCIFAELCCLETKNIAKTHTYVVAQPCLHQRGQFICSAKKFAG